MRKSVLNSPPTASYIVPFALITSLFFFWGFAHSFLDILNKHFQESLHVSKAQSAFVQLMLYGGYFLSALPAGSVISRWGYKKAVIIGLLLYSFGALLFVPGSYLASYSFFLFSLFIIGSGLTFLETAANPYVTVLGTQETASSRLNLAQSFNGLGWILGPMVGGIFVFDNPSFTDEVRISLPYAVIGFLVLCVCFVFYKVRFPEISIENKGNSGGMSFLWTNYQFVFGLIALFCYVAAQTGINSFFINYITETVPNITNSTASLLLSFGGMGLFLFGRLLGSWLMKRIEDKLVLGICALAATILMLVVVLKINSLSVGALILNYLFMSIMFPTIFSIAIKGLGSNTPKASSYLIMSIVGGALAPLLMGYLGESDMSIGFIVPLLCFFIIFLYVLSLYKTAPSKLLKK